MQFPRLTVFGARLFAFAIRFDTGRFCRSDRSVSPSDCFLTTVPSLPSLPGFFSTSFSPSSLSSSRTSSHKVAVVVSVVVLVLGVPDAKTRRKSTARIPRATPSLSAFLLRLARVALSLSAVFPKFPPLPNPPGRKRRKEKPFPGNNKSFYYGWISFFLFSRKESNNSFWMIMSP